VLVLKMAALNTIKLPLTISHTWIKVWFRILTLGASPGVLFFGGGNKVALFPLPRYDMRRAGAEEKLWEYINIYQVSVHVATSP